jgi:hypothetical protein
MTGKSRKGLSKFNSRDAAADIRNKLQTSETLADMCLAGSPLSRDFIIRTKKDLDEVKRLLKHFEKESCMTITAWSNGAHHSTGAGYGLKISAEDRDRYFDRNWENVSLDLDGGANGVIVNIDKKSFWDSKCRELVSKEIGMWLRESGKAPWPKSQPPKLRMEHISGNRFKVSFQK